MPLIILHTHIFSPIDRCFDLSRSIDLHQITTSNTKEKAIAGKTSGLIALDEFVTWEANHFGIRQQLSSKITIYDRPYHFRDEQLTGIFKTIVHDHYFEDNSENITTMKDVFYFESPFGIVGKIFNYLVLTNYLKNLLIKRNNIIKEYAESESWKKLL